MSKDKYCKVNLNDLGPCSNPTSAFSSGKPCIYLKLNKIYGVKNDPYNDAADFPEEMPPTLKDYINGQGDKDQVRIQNWIDFDLVIALDLLFSGLD